VGADGRSGDWTAVTAELPIDQPVWKNGAFLRLWIAQALTQTAQNAIWYALLVLVEDISHSSTQLGITILSVILPSVLFGVPAGAYVDLWDKRKVLVITNVARCLIVLGYMAFASTLILLYIISFFFSIVSQFFAPAETSMIPAIAGPRRLMQANSFFHLTFTASQFVGLVFVGPLLVKVAGLTTFFIAMAVLFAVSSFLVWRLPPQPPAPGTGPQLNPIMELLGQVKEVMGLVLADRRMLASMGYLTLGMTLTLIVAMLAPRFATFVLGIAPEDAVIVLAPAGVGMLTGAFALSRASGGPLTDRQRVITTGFTVVALALGTAAGLPTVARMLGLIRPEGARVETLSEWDVAMVVIVMICALLAGLGFAGIVVASQTLLQERAPRHALARVFAVQLTLGNAASVVPLLLIGGLSDLFGVGYVLLSVAAVVMIVAFLSARHGDTRQVVPSDA
jgi:MFS family permease